MLTYVLYLACSTVLVKKEGDDAFNILQLEPGLRGKWFFEDDYAKDSAVKGTCQFAWWDKQGQHKKCKEVFLCFDHRPKGSAELLPDNDPSMVFMALKKSEQSRCEHMSSTIPVDHWNTATFEISAFEYVPVHGDGFCFAYAILVLYTILCPTTQIAPRKLNTSH